MRNRLFGLEAELAVSAVRAGTAVPTHQLVASLAEHAQRTLDHLPGGFGRLYLENGGLFYVDCGLHPEVATPECTTPTEAVCHLRAGERLVGRLARIAGDELGVDSVLVSRTNVDYEIGTTWGCHESYLGARPVEEYRDWLIPHLVSRIVFTGSGGLDPLSPGIRFSLSPRVAHISRAASTDSTFVRGIFHGRNEPLCRGYSRIHVLAGDNACSQRATWLKVATTALVIALADAAPTARLPVALVDPVGAMQGFARDLRHRAQVDLGSGPQALRTAVEIQRRLLASVEASLGGARFPDWAPEVCAAWKDALDLVESPMVEASCALDWPLKFALFRREIAHRGFTEPKVAAWSDALDRVPRVWTDDDGNDARTTLDPARIGALRRRLSGKEALLAAERILADHGLAWQGLDEFSSLRRQLCAIDIRFGELGSGIFDSLDRQGLIPEHRMAAEAQIVAAATEAPAGSRAAVRGYWIKKLARRGRDFDCSWDRINGVCTYLNLSDPFATAARWKRKWPSGTEQSRLLPRFLGASGAGLAARLPD